MSRLQNTVRDEASCRRHDPRRDRLEKAGLVTGQLEESDQ